MPDTKTEEPEKQADAHVLGILINVDLQTGAMSVGYSHENVDLLLVGNTLANATAAVLGQMGQQRAELAKAMQAAGSPPGAGLAIATEQDLNNLKALHVLQKPVRA